MNTTENNKIIAEFMGAFAVDVEEQDGFWYLTYGLFPHGYDRICFTAMKYHTSFEWLMEVVEKIINLKEVYAQERQKVFNNISPNIKTTYNACLEFIKWHNQQNPKP